MKEFYCVALYSVGESYYYNTHALAEKAMIEKGYTEGDVIYLMRLNEQGQYDIAEEYGLPLSEEDYK